MRRSAAPSYRNGVKRPRFFTSVTNTVLNIDSEINFVQNIENSLPENYHSSNLSDDIHSDSTKLANDKAPDDQNVLRSNKEILDLILSAETATNTITEMMPARISTTAKLQKNENVCILQLPKNFESSERTQPLFETQEIADTSKKYDCETNTDKSKVYSVLWCKRSAKKHKVWEGDGLLIVRNRTAILKNMDGKEIDRGIGYKLKEVESLTDGSKFYIGGKECEIQQHISEEECQSNEYSKHSETSEPSVTHGNNKKFPAFSIRKKFLSTQLLKRTEDKCVKDLSCCELLILPDPTPDHQVVYNKEKLPIAPVQVDSFLVRQLRPHQKEGIIFMYKCILGFQHEYGHGVILADEMGLGKTLQCIALIWTLYKQGPYGGLPVIKHVIIVTPSSLVNNWKNEFHKWLGKSRLSIFSVDQKHAVANYIKLPQSVLIISYEMFLRSSKLLEHVHFDLVVCDEGHRIKNLNIKISNVINCLSTTRRILLTGTPIQNDLAEFFSIVDFVNPGALGSLQYFRKVFEKPILESRNPECSADVKDYGEERSEELHQMTKMFMLRRTQDIINQYLPPKFEAVIFCRPTNLQKALYKHLLNSKTVEDILSTSASVDPSAHLVYISVLRKLCNHPSLLYIGENLNEKSDVSIFDYVKSAFTNNYHPGPEDSGKMRVLEKMLNSLFNTQYHIKEKIVIVSGFTKTLDIIENFCKLKKYFFLRLDGSTVSSSRQDLVDVFNRSYTKYNVFLLSSKAGGVGFNLIGASRIVLYDIDWNPANDLQAMSRIWRDGQKHSVYVYRLLTTGTIEEKIYQRQISKQCLSGTVLNPTSSTKLKFTHEELMDLFTFHEYTDCLTHDSINCSCSDSEPLLEEEKDKCQLNLNGKQTHKISIGEFMNWKHIRGPISKENTSDLCLLDSGTDISFIFLNKVNS